MAKAPFAKKLKIFLKDEPETVLNRQKPEGIGAFENCQEFVNCFHRFSSQVMNMMIAIVGAIIKRLSEPSACRNAVSIFGSGLKILANKPKTDGRPDQ